MKYALLLVAMLTSAACFPQLRIDTEEAIEIGGIRQFITIQAGDTTLPLLLFLHGGPGGSVMNYAERFTDKLREHFIVVQWDQRETGHTLALNSSPVPLTYKVFQDDTYEMVQLLLKRFGRTKLYLVGHSWGTALGFHMVQHYPELLYAYIAIGPMINQIESERIALKQMIEKAEKEKDEKAARELSSIQIPFEIADHLYYHRKWLLAFGGSRKHLSRNYVTRWAETWLDVFNEASEQNLLKTLPVVGCPLYIFAGKNDFQTNSVIAESYYQMLTAPKKGFFWFDTGHSIPSAAPDQMQDIIIKRIRPETFGHGSTF